ncbi:hypothetical protein COLO4_01825, partial [Corchorus olitorius]
TKHADEVGVAALRLPARVFPLHQFRNRDRAQAVVGAGDGAGVVSDVAIHPDHQMLVVALIEEEQIARERLIDVLGDEAAVLLDEPQRRDIRAGAAIEACPPLRERALGGREIQLGRQLPCGFRIAHAVGAQPAGVVGAQRLAGGKAHEAGAVAVRPARRRALAELLVDDANEPRAKHARLVRRKGIGIRRSRVGPARQRMYRRSEQAGASRRQPTAAVQRGGLGAQRHCCVLALSSEAGAPAAVAGASADGACAAVASAGGGVPSPPAGRPRPLDSHVTGTQPRADGTPPSSASDTGA